MPTTVHYYNKITDNSVYSNVNVTTTENISYVKNDKPLFQVSVIITMSRVCTVFIVSKNQFLNSIHFFTDNKLFIYMYL